MKTFYWLLKREFWEHRGGFLWAPVITGAIYLFLFIIGLVSALVMGAHHGIVIGGTDMQLLFNHADAGDLQQVSSAADGFLLFAATLVLMVSGFVILFYCLGSLYDDRRDRSVLFWKSLPVSNISTVLSKVVSAGVIAPVIAVLVGVVVAMVQLILLVLALSIHGIQAWQLLTLVHPIRVVFSILSLIPLSALWALPAIGWFMLCSSWARSKPFLWAVLVPAIAGVLLSWFGILGLLGRPTGWYWTQIFLRIIGSVFPGSFLLWGDNDHRLSAITNDLGDGNPLLAIAPVHTYGVLLTSSSLWVGVAVGAVLIAGAVWFRRTRDDS